MSFSRHIRFLASSLLSIIVLNVSAQESKIDPDNLFPQVKLQTNMGVIIVELDRTKAPLTVDNFLSYVVKGEYDNTIFHRVEKEFVVQGGGYSTDKELKESDKTIVNEAGNGMKNDFATIAMARENKPHSANRQFFFNLADNNSLNPGRKWGYAVFGAIVEGEEVLVNMGNVAVDYDESLGWENVPVKALVLEKATLLPAEF